MKKSFAWILVAALTLTAAGCAKKTASEQLQDDLKKASNEMKREVDSWGK